MWYPSGVLPIPSAKGCLTVEWQASHNFDLSPQRFIGTDLPSKVPLTPQTSVIVVSAMVVAGSFKSLELPESAGDQPAARL